MKLKCLNSGSSGNCYVLEKDDEILILDVGCPLKEVKKALNFDLSKIAGCFISHEHLDHAKYRKDFEKLGIEIFAPYDKDAIRDNRQYGNFNLQAFRLPHGETFSYGLLIRNKDETALYMTDFEYCPYVFKACKVNYYLIECNYQLQYVDFDAPNKEHKLRGHCSLETLKKFLEANKNYDMENVILCHMGFGSTNPQECISDVENIVGCNVVVDYARPNTEYELTDKRLPFTGDLEEWD